MKKMLIILSTSFLMLGVILLTSFQEVKAQENESIVNLASPDLNGKDYLGDGWYRIQHLDGRYDYRYNVYSGEWFMNGEYPSLYSGNETIGFDLPNGTYTLKITVLSGSSNQAPFRFRAKNIDNQWTTYTDLISGQTYTFEGNYVQWRNNLDNGLYDNMIMLIKIEKGDTATDYQVPIEALKQHIQFEKDNSYNEGYDNGYDNGTNINIITPNNDMSNDIWLDGNMISDTYYRYDIIYNDITYIFFEQIEQAYINEIIPTNTIFYIDLNPMYNWLFAKLEDQGNGVYYWTELGTLDPEQPSHIKTIIIDKDGIRFKSDNYYSYFNYWLWDDFDTTSNVLGNSLIGYENDISIDYYDYNSGYQEGYKNGRDYGYELGHNNGLEIGKDIGYNDGLSDGYNDGRSDYGEYFSPGSPNGLEGWYGFQDGYDLGRDYGYDLGYDIGFDDGVVEQDTTYKGVFSIITNAIFTPIALIFGIEILPNISLGMIILVPLLFGLIAFVVGGKKK